MLRLIVLTALFAIIGLVAITPWASLKRIGEMQEFTEQRLQVTSDIMSVMAGPEPDVLRIRLMLRDHQEKGFAAATTVGLHLIEADISNLCSCGPADFTDANRRKLLEFFEHGLSHTTGADRFALLSHGINAESLGLDDLTKAKYFSEAKEIADDDTLIIYHINQVADSPIGFIFGVPTLSAI